MRRWYVESTKQRRVILTHCGLVSQRKCMQRKGSVTSPNIFTIARRVDKAMWVEGLRNESRLSWLSAPKSAYNAARKHNTNMQNSTCKWSTACALRDAADPKVLSPLPLSLSQRVPQRNSLSLLPVRTTF